MASISTDMHLQFHQLFTYLLHNLPKHQFFFKKRVDGAASLSLLLMLGGKTSFDKGIKVSNLLIAKILKIDSILLQNYLQAYHSFMNSAD